MTLVTFELVNNSNRSEFLKGGLSINNQKKAVRDYINRDKLICKCFTCNKIGRPTKSYKLKDKLCPKRKSTNCSRTYPKAIWKCTNCSGNHSAAYRGCPSLKSAISKSIEDLRVSPMHRQCVGEQPRKK